MKQLSLNLPAATDLPKASSAYRKIDERILEKTKLATQIICVITGIFCTLIIAIWSLDLEPKINFAGPSMRFLTALGLIAVASSVFLATIESSNRSWIYRWQQGLASLAFLIGALAFLDPVFHLSLIFPAIGLNSNPLSATINLMSLGLAVVLLPRRAWASRLAQAFAVFSFVNCTFAFIGYIFESQNIYLVPEFLRMSAYSAACILLLATGVLLSQARDGILNIFLSTDSSSGPFFSSSDRTVGSDL
jgi:hypothetical protein